MALPVSEIDYVDPDAITKKIEPIKRRLTPEQIALRDMDRLNLMLRDAMNLRAELRKKGFAA